MKKLLYFLFGAGLISGGGYYFYRNNHAFHDKVNSFLSNSDTVMLTGDSAAEKLSYAKKRIDNPAETKAKPAGPFAALDKYARETPASKEKTFKMLIDYLLIPANTEEEKVRLLFTWTATHIYYDDASFNSGNYADMSAASVLKRHKGVCDGYSNLFKTLCDSAGIKAVKITGYAKGYGYNPGDKFTKTDHAWNAVSIDGKWRLMDVTWASGYGKNVNGKLVSKQQFNNFWYNTNPQAFIFSHLPENPAWQLLPGKIIKLADYERMPALDDSYFAIGFKPDLTFNNALSGNIKTFVKTYPVEYPITIVAIPYRGELEAGKPCTFKLKSAYMQQIAVINNEQWIYFEKNGSDFSLDFTPEAGTVKISVKYPAKGDSFYTFAEYQVPKK